MAFGFTPTPIVWLGRHPLSIQYANGSHVPGPALREGRTSRQRLGAVDSAIDIPSMADLHYSDLSYRIIDVIDDPVSSLSNAISTV